MIRLTTVILIATFMQVSASSFGQRISLNTKNMALEEVLKDIRLQSGYDFLFSEGLIKSSKPISISVKNASIEEVLEKCFNNQPIAYKIQNKTVLLKAKAPSFLDKVAAVFAEDIELRGQVLNKKTNEPLSGVTIKVRNKKVNVGTNAKGEFYLPKLDHNSVITFSYVGFDSVQVKVAEFDKLEAGNSMFGINMRVAKTSEGYYIAITLEPSVSYLDETIVQGYGVTDRRKGTGNISRVTSKDLETQPVMNPLLALQGKVPGMTVTPVTGYASGAVKVEIRGRGVLNGKFTSEPLYIIDGVPLTYLEIGGSSNYENGSTGVVQNEFAGLGAGRGQSPLYNLNPADIESIDVLKDADATAIYGSRGANGVILITTKKGKIGGTTITADVSHGISKVTRHWNMLNTQQYLNMRRQAFKNDGIVPTALNAPDLMVWDTTRYTNWQKELWGNTGELSTASVAMSGGNDNTQFRISSNYTRQTEIMTNSGANKKAVLAFNLTNYAANRKLKTNLNVNYSYSDVNNANTPSVVTMPPNAPPIYNSDGGLNYQEWNDAGLPNDYPFSSIKSISVSKTNLLTANLNVAYELFRDLELSSSFGFNNSHNTGGGFGTIASQNPIDNPTGNANYSTNDNQNWIIEPQLNYKTNIGKGRLTALLGATMQSTNAESKNIYGFGYTDDNLLGSLALAQFTMIMDKSGQYKYAALFGRLNYSWEEKYIVNLSGRRDGSSRFGAGKQFGNFGAVGLAWIASQESWIKNVLPSYISFVKLRGSYGITGSDGIGEYKYLTQWSNVVNYVPVYSYGGITPLVSLHAVNPDYRWQENKKLEGALSVSFLKDKIHLEVAYYRNRCDNQLTDYPTPAFTGFPTVTANWPANIQNSGWEFALSANLMATKNFSWSASMNGGINKNILLSYPNIENSPYATKYKVGKSLNDKYLLHYTGVDPLTGQYAFEDYNRDGHITWAEGIGSADQYVNINLDPKFTGGLGNDFKYKNWSLYLFFQYVNQMGRNPVSTAGGMVNIPLEIYNNQWQGPGQLAKYARFSTETQASDGYIGISDFGYTDASYLRLNNVALSYALPKKAMQHVGLRVFMNAQNVWTFTKYKGLDPTTSTFGGMPTAKVITAGLSLTL